MRTIESIILAVVLVVAAGSMPAGAAAVYDEAAGEAPSYVKNAVYFDDGNAAPLIEIKAKKKKKKEFNNQNPAQMTAKQSHAQNTTAKFSCAKNPKEAMKTQSVAPCAKGQTVYAILYSGNDTTPEVASMGKCVGTKSLICK